MDTFPWVIVAIVILALAVGVFAFIANKARKEEFRKTGKHPKGYYQGKGMAIGIPIGMGIGIALENIGVGVAIGVALGTAFGSGWEKKYADKLRPLTEKEKKIKKYKILFIGGLVLIGLIVFILLFPSKN